MEFKRKQIFDEKGQVRNTNSWIIEIDYDNIDDLLNLQNRIASRLGEMRKNKLGSSTERKQCRFGACASIYNTDISDIYSNLKLDSSPIYYVYAHCEPKSIAVGRDGVTTWAATMGLSYRPFYIGKGSGNRAYDLDRNETHRKVRQKLKEFNQDIKIQIIKENLTELEALCLESKLIDIFGVIGKGGKLTNLDEGLSAPERRKRYASHLCEINNYYKNSLKMIV